MKIIVFNLVECFIDVVTLTPEEEKLLLEEGEDKAFDILKGRGYDVDDFSITWAITDNNFPVYNYGDTKPTYIL